MKFKVGDRVVVVAGTGFHRIPVGMISEVLSAEEDFEFPYELLNPNTGRAYDDNLAEDEIELVEG